MAEIIRSNAQTKSFTFPRSVKIARDGAFHNVKCLESVVLNEGLEMLGEYRDDRCVGVFGDTRLKKIVLPSTLCALEDDVFQKCERLRHVEFRDGIRLEKIEDGTFRKCKSLEKICLPEGLKCMNDGCFHLSGLQEIAIPNSVTTLGNCAFFCCRSLRKVTFTDESKLQTIGQLCFYKTSLEEFVAPPELREIDGGAFYKCSSLKRVALNSGLEVLNEHFNISDE